jgi:hypothetical protein
MGTNKERKQLLLSWTPNFICFHAKNEAFPPITAK